MAYFLFGYVGTAAGVRVVNCEDLGICGHTVCCVKNYKRFLFFLRKKSSPYNLIYDFCCLF